MHGLRNGYAVYQMAESTCVICGVGKSKGVEVKICPAAVLVPITHEDLRALNQPITLSRGHRRQLYTPERIVFSVSLSLGY